MKISDISTAKRLKFKLTFTDSSADFSFGTLIKIEPTQKENEFLVNQYGAGVSNGIDNQILCLADKSASEYIIDLIETEKVDSFRCLFSVEEVNQDSISVQAYTFKSVIEYKSAITIQVSSQLLERTKPENLLNQYVWNQLGSPALFCLNYKNKKKQHSDVRFLSGKRCLSAQNTARGIIADKEYYLKDRDYLPIDVYIAPEIKFIPFTEVVPANDSFAADLDTISTPQTYFARWEAYNKLSKKLLQQESEEFGEIAYTSYGMKQDLAGISFEFKVNEELDNSYIGKELGASAQNTETRSENDKFNKPLPVGAIKKISGKHITTYLETVEIINDIPEKGYISLYTAGDQSIMNRREKAKDRMIKHESPIKSIVALIEEGVSAYELPSSWGNHKPVTDQLKKNFKKAVDLNSEQITALDLAINTPDIAIIQGPPGTGKTTVIKAICERFREIFEAEERQYQKIDPEHSLKSPKILITSFQNEAVDNAISAPLPGDIPAYRKTARRAKESTKNQYQKSLDNWYKGICNSIKESISDQAVEQFVDARKKLEDEYISYKNSGEDLKLAARLISRFLTFQDISYSDNLIEQAKAVINAANNDAIVDDIPDPIVAKIEAQRLDKESFADDGTFNARRLVSHLKVRNDLNISVEIINSINAVCNDAFSEQEFKNYVDAVQNLRKMFCKKGVQINVRDKAKVNECLLEMFENFNNWYINNLTDIESKKSLILSEFLVKLEQEYELLVPKYSMTTAATCQTSMDSRKDSQVFDLVVIDEAARANPLDLFIPMSMGKKIVLVGDHKQLPHMLEPDVLKVILDDPKFKDLPEIEKSLFERLFGMFSKGQKPKAILLKYQFRMHPDICNFVSEAFYDGQLKTSDKITPELRSSPLEINNGKALTFVNIPISKGAETSGVSKSRYIEVEAISNEVKNILKIDPNKNIGVITFYAAQATKINQSLEQILNEEEMDKVEVGTVDAFQGKEFDYVLLSCVRSNKPRNKEELPHVGFLEKPNRLCVAFSRAIRQLIVFGDIETLKQIPCFSQFYNLCKTNEGGCYREY